MIEKSKLFFNGKKKVIGMVHLLPLPGNAAYQNNKEEIVKNAIEDAQVHATYEEDDGYKSYIMKFDENPKLELMSKPTVVDEKKDPNRTGFVHICIKVDSREKLDEIIAKFKAANYTILYEPATNGGNEVRAITFEDNILEVCC